MIKGLHRNANCCLDSKETQKFNRILDDSFLGSFEKPLAPFDVHSEFEQSFSLLQHINTRAEASGY
tara:strand:+ start:285 stop:482 length:198 start_codon:yes stop_codon:yes gene_type:complete